MKVAVVREDEARNAPRARRNRLDQPADLVLEAEEEDGIVGGWCVGVCVAYRERVCVYKDGQSQTVLALVVVVGNFRRSEGWKKEACRRGRRVRSPSGVV